jgi:hypothetical protein
MLQATQFYAACGARGFRGIPQVWGAIDCTHIRINKPKDSGAQFVDRKADYSILVQAVCDADGIFQDVEIGDSGRVHDATMLEGSNLGQVGVCCLLLLQIPNPPPGASAAVHPKKAALSSKARLVQEVLVPMLLVADSAYPCTGYILPAFKHQLTANRRLRRFNFRHALTRGAIERAFGRLKMRFRVLLTRLEQQLENVALIAGACCALHNVCGLADVVGVVGGDVHILPQLPALLSAGTNNSTG